MRSRSVCGNHIPHGKSVARPGSSPLMKLPMRPVPRPIGHMGAAKLGWHAEVFVDAGLLPELIPVFEGTPIALVLDHFGNPGAGERAVEATLEAAARLARTRAVWCKLSAPYRLVQGLDPARLAARWLEVLGRDRLVWGSDWPWTRHEAGRNYGGAAASVDRWVPRATVPAVLWDNPAQLYRFA